MFWERTKPCLIRVKDENARNRELNSPKNWIWKVKIWNTKLITNINRTKSENEPATSLARRKATRTLEIKRSEPHITTTNNTRKQRKRKSFRNRKMATNEPSATRQRTQTRHFT